MAISPVQVVHDVPFAAGSAELGERAQAAVRFARSSSAQLTNAWLQLAGFAAGDGALASVRATVVRDALVREGVAPERIVVPVPGAVRNRRPMEPDRVEVVLCPAAISWCLPR